MERAASAGALVFVILAIVLVFARHQWIERKIAPVRHPQPLTWARGKDCLNGVHRLTVMIGDSRLTRWPADLSFGDPVVNLGIAGETTPEMAARFRSEVAARCPGTILIASGINDLVAASLMDRSEGREVASRLTRTLIELAEYGARSGARVYVGTIIPPATPDLLRRLVWSWSVVDYVARVNQELRAHTWEGTVALIDFATCLDPSSKGILDPGFREDTLHLNRRAYRQLRDLIVSALPP